MSAPPPYIPSNALFTAVKAQTISVDGNVAADTFTAADGTIKVSKAGSVTLVAGAATVSGLALTSDERAFVVSNGSYGQSSGALAVTVTTTTTSLAPTSGSFVVRSNNILDTSKVNWFLVGSDNFT